MILRPHPAGGGDRAVRWILSAGWLPSALRWRRSSPARSAGDNGIRLLRPSDCVSLRLIGILILQPWEPVGELDLASTGPFSGWLHPAASTIKPTSPASPSLPAEKMARSRADDGILRQTPRSDYTPQGKADQRELLNLSSLRLRDAAGLRTIPASGYLVTVIILETLGDCAIFVEILSRFGPLIKESARNELCKEIALWVLPWRLALALM